MVRITNLKMHAEKTYCVHPWSTCAKDLKQKHKQKFERFGIKDESRGVSKSDSLQSMGMERLKEKNLMPGYFPLLIKSTNQI